MTMRVFPPGHDVDFVLKKFFYAIPPLKKEKVDAGV